MKEKVDQFVLSKEEIVGIFSATEAPVEKFPSQYKRHLIRQTDGILRPCDRVRMQIRTAFK